MHFSDTDKRITGKFMRPFEGQYFISKALSLTKSELEDNQGKPRGTLNKRDLKTFRMET
jgi:hypothetical protein